MFARSSRHLSFVSFSALGCALLAPSLASAQGAPPAPPPPAAQPAPPPAQPAPPLVDPEVIRRFEKRIVVAEGVLLND